MASISSNTLDNITHSVSNLLKAQGVIVSSASIYELNDAINSFLVEKINVAIEEDLKYTELDEHQVSLWESIASHHVSAQTLFDSYSGDLAKATDNSHIERLSKEVAIDIVFDVKEGDNNKHIRALNDNARTYDAIMLASSLTFSMDGLEYVVEPYLSGLTEGDVLALLSDVQEHMVLAITEYNKGRSL
jgi:hypothetical protein